MRLAIALALTLLASPAFAADSSLITRPSKFPVKETADRLVKALEDKGLKVAARVDHAAGAKAAGMDMAPAEVVMFGNPKLGTPLMKANPDIAIDLPMRVLIWTDAAGKVLVGYTAPEVLKARYGITGQDDAFKTMGGALEAFTKAAAE